MSRGSDISPPVGGASLMVAWRLAGRRVLVAGGGAVAAGRVRLALEADAEVVLVAPEAVAELQARARRGELTWRPRAVDPQDLEGADMVLVAIDDPEGSERIAGWARAARIPVNVADQPDRCDFWFPSVHREGPVQIAVSSGGNGPALAVRLRQTLGRRLPRRLAEAVAGFGALRRAIRAADEAPEAAPHRMGWLAQIGREWSFEALSRLEATAIAALVDRYQAGEGPPEPPRGRGRVRLVGAGPGDPDLLTVAARRALEEADLVLADRLIPAEILALTRGELRVAGKVPGRADAAQGELERWMIDGARAGRDVVRLKCGDPYLFGRGGEEVAVLAEAGIVAEVVPGVTSALAAPLASGIPTTLRGVADRVVVVTGHGRGDAYPEVPAYDPGATVLWLMAVGRIGHLVAAMRSRGYPDALPVAVVERATHPDQRTVTTTLASLEEVAQAEAVRAPAVLVVGHVVAHRASGTVERALEQPAREARVA